MPLLLLKAQGPAACGSAWHVRHVAARRARGQPSSAERHGHGPRRRPARLVGGRREAAQRSDRHREGVQRDSEGSREAATAKAATARRPQRRCPQRTRARTAATAAEARAYRSNGCIRGARAEHQMTHAYTSTRNGSKRSVALALVICGDVWPCAALQALATPLLMPLACMKTTSHRALADHRWFVGIRKAQAGAWSIYSF